MARRSDVMHYTLDHCKDRKGRVSGIFGRRRRPPPCQRYGRGSSGRALLAKYGRHTDHTAAVVGSVTARMCTEAGSKEREGGLMSALRPVSTMQNYWNKIGLRI